MVFGGLFCGKPAEAFRNTYRGEPAICVSFFLFSFVSLAISLARDLVCFSDALFNFEENFNFDLFFRA